MMACGNAESAKANSSLSSIVLMEAPHADEQP
jgi:hypothetical protein